MVHKKDIDLFLEDRKIAIAGVSRNPSSFSRTVYKDLKEKGYKVYAINPLTDTIDGDNSFKDVSELPKELKNLLIMTPKSESPKVLNEAIEAGLKSIWINQGSETEECLKIAEEAGIDIIYKKCIYMFAEPVSGIHKFHRTINRIFGLLPKD